MTAAPLYVATLADRDGDAVHLEFLAGRGAREAQRWAEKVMAGLLVKLGRSAGLVEFVISADRAPVYGMACPVEDAVAVCAEYLRKLDADDEQISRVA